MRALLDTPLRELLRNTACCLFVGTVLWMPVLVALLKDAP